jgi:hypothetical protein
LGPDGHQRTENEARDRPFAGPQRHDHDEQDQPGVTNAPEVVDLHAQGGLPPN